MRAIGVLAAAPTAALVLASQELSRLPSDALVDGRWAGAFACLLRAAVSTFAPAAMLLSLAAAALIVRERSMASGSETAPRRGTAALVALALCLLGVLQCGLVWRGVLERPSLAWSAPVLVVCVVAAVALGALHLALAVAPRRAAFALGGTVAVGALAATRLHYGVAVGHYPSLHAAALGFAYVGLALGVALVLAAALDRPAPTGGRAPTTSRSRRGPVALLSAAGVAVAALLLASVAPPASADAARPHVIAFTELGRGAGVAEALTRDRDGLVPTTLPGRRVDELVRPDPRAAARFAEHSGLPALPAEFDLSAHDVLLVLSDATRHDRARGLPNLRRLGAAGQVHERAYAPSNGTFASLSAMLAMTPVSFAALDVRQAFWRGRLRDEQRTAAEAMRAGGRSTFWVGHDHRGCFSTHQLGLEQGFDERTLVFQERGEARDADVDARIADAAVDTIERHQRAGRRFFGLVFLVSPHDDYQAHGAGDPDASELTRYDDELRFMDAQLGRVLDALDDDAIVIFAGDHGEAFGEHGHHHHLTSVFDEQIHVPLVVRVPGLAPARHRAPTSTGYVLPWLLSRGAAPEREAAREVLERDVGPMMRALDGAVVSEMIGPRRQEVSLVWPEHTLVYDVLAGLTRVFDARRDEPQLHDLSEARPELFARLAPFARRYRRARFAGRRFRFVEDSP